MIVATGLKHLDDLENAILRGEAVVVAGYPEMFQGGVEKWDKAPKEVQNIISDIQTALLRTDTVVIKDTIIYSVPRGYSCDLLVHEIAMLDANLHDPWVKEGKDKVVVFTESIVDIQKFISFRS
jgi:hypothetical protein